MSGTLEEEITPEPNLIILSMAKLSLQTRRALPKGSLSQEHMMSRQAQELMKVKVKSPCQLSHPCGSFFLSVNIT